MSVPLEIPTGFPETILANKTIFPSRLSCENNYGKCAHSNSFFEKFRGIYITFIALILFLPFLFSKLIPQSRILPSNRRLDFLFLSHYVGKHKSYNLDPFLGSITNTLASKFTTLTFFLNSTKEHPSRVEETIEASCPREFQVNRFAWNATQLIQATFFMSVDLLKVVLGREDTFRELKESLCFDFIATYRSQLSILMAWENFAPLLYEYNPKYVLMPCEGNTHELLFLYRVKKYFPQTRVVMYQHAPLVVDQPGFYRVVANMGSRDTLLLSSSHSEKLIRMTVPGKSIRCQVSVVGSSRKIPTTDMALGRKSTVASTSRHVLIVPEGTECSVNELLSFLQRIDAPQVFFDFRIRLHPDYFPSRRVETLLGELRPGFLISYNSLEADLLWADEVWLRTSSVVDAALRLQVLPVHFNVNPKVDLNPLRGLNQPYLEVKSFSDLENLDKQRNDYGHPTFSSLEKDFLFQEFDTVTLLDLFN